MPGQSVDLTLVADLQEPVETRDPGRLNLPGLNRLTLLRLGQEPVAMARGHLPRPATGPGQDSSTAARSPRTVESVTPWGAVGTAADQPVMRTITCSLSIV